MSNDLYWVIVEYCSGVGEWISYVHLLLKTNRDHIGISFINWNAAFLLGQLNTLSYLVQAKLLQRFGSAEGCYFVYEEKVSQDLWVYVNYKGIFFISQVCACVHSYMCVRARMLVQLRMEFG